MSFVIASQIALWVALLVLGVVCMALARQIGVLHQRIAPAGALSLSQPLKLGDATPEMTLAALDGSAVKIGGVRGGRSQLLLFLSPDCAICEALLPAVRSAHGAERAWLDIVLASDGEPHRHVEFVREKSLGEISLRRLRALGAQLRSREAALRGADRRGGQIIGDRPRQYARAFGKLVRGQGERRQQHPAIPRSTRPEARLFGRIDVAQFDHLAEKVLRGFASRTSRRSRLQRARADFSQGAAALPLLPVARAAEAGGRSADDPNSGRGARRRYSGNPQDPGDRTKCDYWRYCAIDGSLCSCYGGSVVTCPPGTEMSPITWIGTCRNPADERNYIISYNDCCGGVAWGRCACQNNQRRSAAGAAADQQRDHVVFRHQEPVLHVHGGHHPGHRLLSRSRLAARALRLAAALSMMHGAMLHSAAAQTRAGEAASAPAVDAAPAGVDDARRAWQNWTLNCQGCHRVDGSGSAGTAPSLAGSVAKFVRVTGGREYLGRVPGVATSPLSDADLAEVVNWMLWRFDKQHLPSTFQPFTAAEIGRLRTQPLRLEASQMRSDLLRKADESGPP